MGTSSYRRRQRFLKSAGAQHSFQLKSRLELLEWTVLQQLPVVTSQSDTMDYKAVFWGHPVQDMGQQDVIVGQCVLGQTCALNAPVDLMRVTELQDTLLIPHRRRLRDTVRAEVLPHIVMDLSAVIVTADEPRIASVGVQTEVVFGVPQFQFTTPQIQFATSPGQLQSGYQQPAHYPPQPVIQQMNAQAQPGVAQQFAFQQALQGFQPQAASCQPQQVGNMISDLLPMEQHLPMGQPPIEGGLDMNAILQAIEAMGRGGSSSSNG